MARPRKAPAELEEELVVAAPAKRGARKPRSSSSSVERLVGGSHGGRRKGAGAKVATLEERARRSMAAAAAESDFLRERVEALLKVTGLSPRRRLLLGERVSVRTDGDWVADVIRKTCVQTIGRWKGLPLKLEPWQRAYLRDALAFDDQGEYLYGTSLLGIPRKNGKTTTTAGIAVVKASPCDGEGRPEVLLAAGSRDQAGPLFGHVSDFVAGSPLLSSVLLASLTDVKCPANGGIIRTLAGDGKLNHGANPYYTAADELHSWTSPRQTENWTALTTADGARDDALVAVISTAGYDRRTVLGELYEQAYASPFRVDRPDMGDGGFVVLDPEARLCVHWYAIGPRTELDDLDAWKRANPASWRSKERIRRDLAKRTVDESAKRRLYGNVWTSARHVWIPDLTWAELADRELVERTLAPGARVGLAVDASLNHDTTAVAIAAQTEDGRVAVKVRVFSTRRDVPAHVYFVGSTIDLPTVERYIAGELLGIDPDDPWAEVEHDAAGDVLEHDLAAELDVAIVGYDPRYFNRSATVLEAAGLTTARYEPQGRETWEAVQGFYNLATGGGIVHDGDPVLAAHVAAAAGEKTDRGWRVSKLKSSNPIDGAIAAVLAVDLAVDGLDVDGSDEPWAATW